VAKGFLWSLQHLRRLGRKGSTMTAATLTGLAIEGVHLYVISDEELEAAAEESALSYTYQTSAYQMCCY
jgi:hypothetical protein